MKSISIKNKIFWTNFLVVLFVFIIAWILLSGTYDYEYEVTYFNFRFGYYLVSFFAIIYSCYRISMDYVRNEKIEEFREETKLSNKEFNEKYRNLLDKIL